MCKDTGTVEISESSLYHLRQAAHQWCASNRDHPAWDRVIAALTEAARVSSTYWISLKTHGIEPEQEELEEDE
jgi:hypothetical protein